MTDDAVFSDDGTYLGEMAIADDGARVLVDGETGEITAAIDEQGNPLDPAGYAIEGDDQGDDLEDLRAELDELQQWRENYNPNAAGDAGREFSEQLDDEQWALATGRELRNLEEQLGRPLTLTEMHSLLAEARGDHEAGLPSDVGEAVDRATGLIPYLPGQDHGETEHEHADARRQYMSQLIADSETVERGAMPGEQPERRAEYYDMGGSDRGHEGRVAKALDSIAGHDVSDRDVNSSDPQPDIEGEF